MIHVVGGTYFETCRSPRIQQFYGSGGRAAAALGNMTDVVLHTYATPESGPRLEALSKRFAFEVVRHVGEQTPHFDYPHGLHNPSLSPSPTLIRQMAPIEVKADLVLAFGMIEGSGNIDASIAIYDPQSETMPRPFSEIGRADRLAIVGNVPEIRRLGHSDDFATAAEKLRTDGASVVIVKQGPAGATVFHPEGTSLVPPFRSNNLVPIGSGDVFSAAFAWFWGHEGLAPVAAARYASQCVSTYMENRVPRVLPGEALEQLSFVEASVKPGQVYLAGPFFTMTQLRLIEEALGVLRGAGVKVFSPYHEIGLGGPEVARKDLAGLDKSDRVLAILDGCDPGTVFEIGYAVALGRDVVAYCEDVPAERLTMIRGTDCTVVSDFATALYRTIWGW